MARPRLHDTAPADCRLSLRVTPAQRIELRRVAAENRTDLPAMLREAVAEYCATHRERQRQQRRRR